jgi:hypothetical protein
MGLSKRTRLPGSPSCHRGPAIVSSRLDFQHEIVKRVRRLWRARAREDSEDNPSFPLWSCICPCP